MTTTTPSLADLDLGRAAAERELTEARAEYGRAAYEHAADRENPDKHKAVLKAQERISLLEAEIQGLSAATTEAARRAEDTERRAELTERRAQLKAADKAMDAVRAAFAEAAPMLEKLGVLRQHIADEVQLVSGNVYSATFFDSPADRAHFQPSGVHPQAFANLWNGLLQAAQVVPFEVFCLDNRSTADYVGFVDREVGEVREVIAKARARVDTQFSPKP